MLFVSAGLPNSRTSSPTRNRGRLLSKTIYRTRRDASVAVRDGVDIWIVIREGWESALIWYGGSKTGIELMRSTTRKSLIALAKRLEAIPDQAIWDAENVGKFETLTKAQIWVADYSRHAGNT